MTGVRLRGVEPGDLEAFFHIQLDAEAAALAAFGPADPGNRQAFDLRWRRILADPAVTARTITDEAGVVVGHIQSFLDEGTPELTYWVDRARWGEGIGTAAVAAFLKLDRRRPLCARVAADNSRSVAVLERHGFRRIQTSAGFAPGRGKQVLEHTYRLD